MRSGDLWKYATDPARNRSLVSGAIALAFSGMVWCAVHLIPMPHIEETPTPVLFKGQAMSERGQSWASVSQAFVVEGMRVDTDAVRHLPGVQRGKGTRTLIGRSVDMRGTVVQIGAGRGFWLDEDGYRVFVVRHEEPHAVAPSTAAWERLLPHVLRGQVVRVQGTVEALPARMDCEAWGLDAVSHRELERAGVFIDAVYVSAERRL